MRKSGGLAKYCMLSFREFLEEKGYEVGKIYGLDLPKIKKQGSGGDHTSPGKLLAKAVQPAKLHVGAVPIFKVKKIK